MERVKNQENVTMKILSTLLIMYVITGAALLVLALLLYKMQLGENAVSLGIMIIYVVSGLSGGFIAGKRLKTRRFLWGALMGAIYFLVLFVGSAIMNRGIPSDALHSLTTWVMCMAAGMIGGMLS